MQNNIILIIEDEAEVSEIIQSTLKREAFQVLTAFDGSTGLEMARTKKPALILLDIMMPGINGLEVCKQLRTQPETKNVPIIMLTAKIDESDIVLGLGAGADDYVTKPFHSKELVARVRAVLRRHRIGEASETAHSITQGGIQMDVQRHEVKLNGQEVTLTLAEFKILWTLLSTPGRVFTRNQLLDRISSGDGDSVVDRNIDVHIGAIRKKLGDTGRAILTVRGIGYKFRGSESDEKSEAA